MAETLRDTQNTPREFRATLCIERRSSTPPADFALPILFFRKPETDSRFPYISGKFQCSRKRSFLEHCDAVRFIKSDKCKPIT